MEMCFEDFRESAANALTGSDRTMAILRAVYPQVSRQLEHKKQWTTRVMVANGYIKPYRINYDLQVEPFRSVGSGADGRLAPSSWFDYRLHIQDELNRLFRKMLSGHGCKHLVPVLDQFVAILATEMYGRTEYHLKLPMAELHDPTDEIEINFKGAYEVNGWHVVWVCGGGLALTDQRFGENNFSLEFSGCPDIKVLVIDFSLLNKLEEELIAVGFEEGARLIREKNEQMKNDLDWTYFTK